ncbi:MAG: translocation/assembly module TamB domain-containing protein, partial [Trueperaceae bacterium]|nr:translocation/assembly module TamB domain-containing protein [Trueperaceae bacterium]
VEVGGALAAPRLHASVGGDVAVAPAVPGVDLDVDMRGSVVARVVEGGVEIDGELGPVSLQGAWGDGRTLEAVAERLVVAAAPATAVLGDVRATLAPADLGWRLAGGAEVVSLDAQLPGTMLAIDTVGRLRFEAVPGLLELRDELGRFEVRLADDEGRVRVAALPLTLAGLALTADGSLERADDGRWAGNARVAGEGVELAVASDGGWEGTFDVAIDAGTVIGPWTAGVDVRAEGEIGAETFSASGSAGALHFDGEGRLGADGGSWRAGARHGDDALAASGEAGAWRASGHLPIGPLLALAAPELASSVAGVLEVDLAAPAGGEVDGRIGATTTAPAALTAEVRVDGSRADIVLAGTLLGEELRADGALWPTLDATLSWGAFGPVRASADAASGSGTLPAITTLGVHVSAQPWSLSVDGPNAAATLSVGASSLEATWASGVEVRARVEQPLELGGSPALVLGTAQWSADRPEGEVALTLSAPELHLEASLTGDLERASVAATAPAAALSTIVAPGVDLTGDLALAGDLFANDAASDLLVTWRTNDVAADALEASVRIDGADWTVRGSGPGIEVHASREAWSVAADGFDPTRLLAIPELDGQLAGQLDVRLDGALARDDRGWTGALVGTLAGVVPGNVRLVGAGDTIDVFAHSEGAYHEAFVDGTWGAEPRFDVRASLVDATATIAGSVDLDGSVQRRQGAWEGRGSVTTTAGDVGPLAWPALAANWAFEAGALRAGGASGLVGLITADANGVAGAWQVPVTVGGIDHTLRLEAGEDVRASIDGPVLRLLAREEGGDWHVEGVVERVGVLLDGGEDAGWSEPLGAVSLAVSVTPPGAGDDVGRASPWRWQVRAAALASVGPTTEREAEVVLAAAGTSLDGAGTLSVGPDGAPHLVVGVTLTDGVVTAAIDGDDVDVEALARLWDAPLTGSVSGRLGVALDVARSPTLEVRGDVHADLDYGGTAFALDVASTASGAWSVRGSTADGVWSGAVTAPERAALATGGAMVVLDGPEASLRGRVSLEHGEAQLRLAGAAAGRNLALALALDGGSATGNATWGASRLEVEIGAEAAAARAHLARSDVPGGPWTFVLDVDRTAGTRIERLSLHAPGEGVRLDLAGDALPTDLQGRVTWRDLERPLRVRRLGDATWRVDSDALALYLAPDGTIGGGGSASIAIAGAEVSVDLDALAWHTARGWTGGASAVVRSGAFAAHGAATATDAGSLSLLVTADADGTSLGGATIEVPAALAEPLRGDVDLHVDGLAGGATGAWGARISGTIDGTLGDPRLDADLTLRGPAPARGRLHAGSGSLRADLVGEDLVASARLDGGVWRARLHVDGADVSTFVPWVASPRLHLSAEARLDGSGIEVNVDEVRLSNPTSSVTGGGRLGPDGELRVTLRTDVDLADLRLGTDLAGRLVGPLTIRYGLGAALTSADVTGMLQVRDATVAGVPGTFSGDVQIAGPTADPRLLATLEASGDARGSVRADLRPRRPSGRIDADLNVGPLEARIRAALDGSALEADGRISFDGFALTLASDGAGGVALQGSGGLDGWSGRLAAEPWALEVAGDLRALDPVRGTIGLAVRWDEGGGPRPRIEGTWEGLAIGPLSLPDAEVTSDADGTWRARGDGVDVRVHLATGAWSIDLDEASLALGDAVDALELRLTAAGTGARGRGDATIAGVTPQGVVDLHASLAFDDALDVTAGGVVLGGVADVAIARTAAGTWTGGGTLAGVALGDEALDVALSVSGDAALPAVRAEGAWGGDRVAAALTFEAGRLGADVRLTLPDADLVAAGELWPSLDVTLGSGAPGTAAGGAEAGTARIFEADDGVRIEGSFDVVVAGVRARLDGAADGAPRLALTSDWTDDTALVAVLPIAPPADHVERLLDHGLTFDVTGDGSGRVSLTRVAGTWGIGFDAVLVRAAGTAVRAGGRLEPGRGRLDVSVDVPDALGDVLIRGLPQGGTIDATVVLEGDTVVVTTAAPWTTRSEIDLAARRFALDADVAWTGPDAPGRVRGRLELDAETGVRGAIELGAIDVGHPDLPGSLRFDGSVRGVGGALQVQASARARRSSLSFTGTLPLDALARAGWGVDDARVLQATARLSALDLEELPWLQEVAPFARGVVSGAVVAQAGQVVGQLVAEELDLAGTALPSTLTLAGDATGVDLRLEVGTRREAILTGSWRDGSADVLARLERFPVHTLVEAIVGPSDVSALVTGVARAGWDPSRPDALDLRLATEDVRLERAGVVTTGTVTFELADGALVIREASFVGSGAWSARGEIRPDRLDVELLAENADFGPLLGLVPALARYGIAADGDLELVGRGTLADPTLRVRSDGLRLEVAGTRYELAQASLDLVGTSLTVDGVVRGLAPLGGEVRVTGDGVVRLQPFELVRADLRAIGDIDVPVLGRVSDVDGVVRARSGEAPTIAVDALVGEPVRVEGTLAPFDVRAVGRGIEVAVPDVFVANATVDADLRARIDGGVVVSGRLDVAQARLDLASRAAAREGLDPGDADAMRDTAGRRAALQLVRFDGVRIVAPQRVTLSETIGTAEAAIDLTLTGDAADPQLEGSVSSVRGTFRFSSVEFALARAVARFEPARGILPVIEVLATTSFDKTRVASGSDVRFAAPPGPRFDVTLRFDAEVSTAGPDGGVGVDLIPRLTSDALIEVSSGSDGLSAGTRSLSELELLSLIALGRLDVGAGTEGIASTFAGRAIDTAVDLLVVAELQAALSEALGLDVVEIRTTALSDLFGGRSDPFSVSLRFGGYLSDELFASYRVGTFDDAERAFAVTNELAFTYELGPVAFDLAGRINFPSAAASAPVPSLTGSVRYDVTRSFAFEAGLDVGSASQTARFGVTIRW